MVAYAWHVKEAVRFLYHIPNPDPAARYLAELAADLQVNDFPIEVRSLGRTLARWRVEIVNWHRSRATTGPAEAINNLVKRVKRAAFGFRKFRHYRIRSLPQHRPPRLEPPTHHHSPLKSEEPANGLSAYDLHHYTSGRSGSPAMPL